jgi:hypothetical protein
MAGGRGKRWQEKTEKPEVKDGGQLGRRGWANYRALEGTALGAQGGRIARDLHEAQLIAYASQLSLARWTVGDGKCKGRKWEGKWGMAEWHQATVQRDKRSARTKLVVTQMRDPTIVPYR